MSKTELASRISVTPGYLMHLESGRTKPPSLDRCRQIAGALTLTPDQAHELISVAAEERISGEELDYLRQRKDFLNASSKPDSIRGQAHCPYCKQSIEVEVKNSGDISIYGRMSEKVKRIR